MTRINHGRSILIPFQTRYGLTTSERMARNAPIHWRKDGIRKHIAVEHAQRAANALGRTVIIVERDEGMGDFYTCVDPEE